MKHLPEKLILLLSLLLTATGCSYEIESDDCPLDPDENNVILRFDLRDKDAQDIFNENIDHVEVFAFDEAGKFVSSQPVTKAQLTSFRGTYFTLRPGVYSFVAWANHGDKCTASPMQEGVTHIDDCCMDHITTDNCDKLFFGPGISLVRGTRAGNQPLRLTVPQKGIVDETMQLGHAHKVINVLVQDYRDGGITGILPQTQLTGVWRGYDFSMGFLKDSPLTLTQQTVPVTTPDGDMAHSRFVVTSFDDDNTIILHLKNPAGTSDYQVVLNEYIDANQIELEVEIVIPIVIKYNMDTSITIYLPSWGEQGIIPKPM